MELWIRSQDRTNIILAKDIVVSKGNIKVYKDTELCTTVANYETKERALEVLDEIHQRLINLGTIEIVPDSYIVLPKDTSNVYEMPEE